MFCNSSVTYTRRLASSILLEYSGLFFNFSGLPIPFNAPFFLYLPIMNLSFSMFFYLAFANVSSL